MIDYELWLEANTHKKGEPYPEHEWHEVNSYFTIMNEQMNEHNRVFASNEGIAKQIDSVYNTNPDAKEARYFYMRLKEVKRRY